MRFFKCFFLAGLYHSGRQRSTSEYLMGNRDIQVVPAALSLTVSFISSILILGEPAEMYTFGGQLMISKLGWVLGAVLSTVIFVPVLHPLKLTSVNEVCSFMDRLTLRITVDLYRRLDSSGSVYSRRRLRRWPMGVEPNDKWCRQREGAPIGFNVAQPLPATAKETLPSRVNCTRDSPPQCQSRDVARNGAHKSPIRAFTCRWFKCMMT